MYIRRVHGLGTLGIDVLSDLNAAIQWSKDTVSNALPTWAGGSPLTSDQLAAIQAQAAQQIAVASGGNTALAQQATAQMQAETTAIAQQSRTSAQKSDTTLPNPFDPSSSFNFSSWLLWGGLGLLGVVLLVKLIDR